MKKHTISFHQNGTAHCLWTEVLPLQELGQLELQRASTVDWDPKTQQWKVRLASAPDAVAFSHSSRDTCLEWERTTLNALL